MDTQTGSELEYAYMYPHGLNPLGFSTAFRGTMIVKFEKQDSWPQGLEQRTRRTQIDTMHLGIHAVWLEPLRSMCCTWNGLHENKCTNGHCPLHRADALLDTCTQGPRCNSSTYVGRGVAGWLLSRMGHFAQERGSGRVGLSLHPIVVMNMQKWDKASQVVLFGGLWWWNHFQELPGVIIAWINLLSMKAGRCRCILGALSII